MGYAIPLWVVLVGIAVSTAAILITIVLITLHLDRKN